jgi:AcrR family transcriptional regulator
MPSPEPVSAPRTRHLDKLGPDPTVRREILAAASATLQEQGVRGLTIAVVLDRAAVSARAFYRHFGSKDELVAALFLAMARTEERRLRRRMASAATEPAAVAAWVDGRLDLEFDATVEADQRRQSLRALSQTDVRLPKSGHARAYAQLLKPLSETLRHGLQRGVFRDIDPVADAQAIHAVVRAGIERQWATGDAEREAVRERMIRFCLRGLIVTADAATEI